MFDIFPLAKLFLQHENEPDAVLEQQLVALGMSEVEARQWLVLMPLAFARAAYRFQLPELKDEENQYVQCHISGQVDDKVLKLDQLAPYMLAHSWACDCGLMDQISSKEYNAIVRRSLEFEAIQALRAGSIQTLPPLMLTI